MAMGTHWNPQKETIQEIVTLIDSIRLEIKELRQLNSTSKHCLVESARESGQGQSSAYKMFDGMRSKNDVFFPSEIPEIQSTGLNEDVTRFNLGSQIDNQVNERTLLVKIHHEVFPISCRELDMVFSRCGILEKLEKFSTENEFHSMVCFQNKESALEAFNSFNGRNIYDEGCEMELILGSTLAKERRVCNEAYSSDEVSMERGFQQTVTHIYPTQQVQALSQQQLQDSHSYSEDHQAPIEFRNGSSKDSFKMSGMATHRSQETNVNSKAKANLASAAQPRGKFEKWCEKETGMDQNKEVIPSASSTDVVQASQICQEHDLSVEKSREIGTIFHSGLNLKVPSTMMNLEQENLKVIPFPDFAKVVASDVVAYRKLGELEYPFDCIEDGLDNLKVNSIEFLADSSAHNVFDNMPMRSFSDNTSSIQVSNVHLLLGICVFDPRIDEGLSYMSNGLSKQFEPASLKWEDYGLKLYLGSQCNGWKFVPRFFAQRFDARMRDLGESSHYNSDLCAGIILVFDPGGLLDQGRAQLNSSYAAVLVYKCWVLDGLILAWDPGGSYMSIFLSWRQ